MIRIKTFYNIDTIELIELNFKNRCTNRGITRRVFQLDLQFERSGALYEENNHESLTSFG